MRLHKCWIWVFGFLQIFFSSYPSKKKKTHPKKQKTKENTPITWKRKCYLHFQENCLFEGRVTDQFDKSASAFNIYEQITNLDVWIEILIYLLQKKISICNKTGGGFSPTLRKWKLSLVSITSWHIKSKDRFHLNMIFDHPFKQSYCLHKIFWRHYVTESQNYCGKRFGW